VTYHLTHQPHSNANNSPFGAAAAAAAVASGAVIVRNQPSRLQRKVFSANSSQRRETHKPTTAAEAEAEVKAKAEKEAAEEKEKERQKERDKGKKKLMSSASAPLMVGNPAKAIKSSQKKIQSRRWEAQQSYGDEGEREGQRQRPFQMNVTKYLDHRYHVFETLIEKTFNSLCIELRPPPHTFSHPFSATATATAAASPLLLSRSSPLLHSAFPSHAPSPSPWSPGRRSGHSHGHSSGAGVEAGAGTGPGYIIESIHPESNAYRQDILRRHDEILEVNGLSCMGLGFEELMDLIQRDRDQFVLLLIRRRRRSAAGERSESGGMEAIGMEGW
jgi:hypothetical protein